MINNFHIILFIITILFAGCVDEDVLSTKAEAVTGLDSIDYEILSDGIEQIIFPSASFKSRAFFFHYPFGSSPDTVIIGIRDSTEFTEPKPHILEYHRLIDSNDYQISRRLATENHKKFKIDEKKVHSKVGLAFFNIGPEFVYDEFIKKVSSNFRDWAVLISKPSYNDEKNRAVMYILVGGYDTEHESIAWFKKVENKWMLSDIIDYSR
ncbi:MAG: hypothetical protein IT281_01465 [Ignavibacteria bacterium]|nr:hypothetical protein [Ignavibacteria bacterium]MCC7158186.1 hypothetical protein [Ignavibacteria bacterium]